MGERARVSAKAAADQRGHGIGVNMDVYTKADLTQKREVVNTIERMVLVGTGGSPSGDLRDALMD